MEAVFIQILKHFSVILSDYGWTTKYIRNFHLEISVPFEHSKSKEMKFKVNFISLILIITSTICMAKQRTNSKKLSEKSEREGKSMIIMFNKYIWCEIE